MDSQIAPLERIVKFCHAHNTRVGVQLGHGGTCFKRLYRILKCINLYTVQVGRPPRWRLGSTVILLQVVKRPL